MNVVLSALGKFHTFDLAREMQARGALRQVFSTYPWFKLTQEGLPASQVRTFPWVNTPYLAMPQRERLGQRLLRGWEYLNCISFDRYTANRLPPCDVFVGLSSSALWSGRRARQQGARFVCDRGSSHIRTQDALLREEHAHWRMPYMPTDPRIIAREEAEYAEADCITVPSTFSHRSFEQQGVDVRKLRRLSYGVNLSAFHPAGTPSSDTFDVLFVGSAELRKGLPYLLQAFKALRHPRKSLSLAGTAPLGMIEHMKALGLWSDGIQLLGHLEWNRLREQMSRSHVLVLPSIEDGFGLVMAQAMACACPVIATENTGAPDLYEDGQAGYIVPIRQSDILADRLQSLADSPDTRQRMSQAALQLVQDMGGWRRYGDEAMRIYRELLT